MSLNYVVVRHKPLNHTFHHFADRESKAQEGVWLAMGSQATRAITSA